MAHNVFEGGLPLKAASIVGQYVAVSFLTGGSALGETVIRSGSLNDLVVGMTIASAAAGEPVDVQIEGVTKAIAGASLGAGALVGVGSTNGVLIPQAASFAATSMALRYVVGQAQKNAAAGDLFPVMLRPQQII